MSDRCAWCKKGFRLPIERVQVMCPDDPLTWETVHLQCYLAHVEEARLMEIKGWRRVPLNHAMRRPFALDGT